MSYTSLPVAKLLHDIFILALQVFSNNKTIPTKMTILLCVQFSFLCIYVFVMHKESASVLCNFLFPKFSNLVVLLKNRPFFVSFAQRTSHFFVDIE
jgi:hypothetical protein